MCSCFTSSNELVMQQENSEGIKPCGMFGQKTYQEVLDELAQKSKYTKHGNTGFISVIIKSGDDLR